jgi:hypothetical protein
MTTFQSLIDTFAEKFDETMSLQENGTLGILFNDDMLVQIELDSNESHLMVGGFIATVPPGKYREKVFFEALKENSTLDETYSCLCYANDESELVLFSKLSFHALSAEHLYDYLELFVEKASRWKLMVDKGKFD